MNTKNVYTIPAGIPFAKALAAKLLQDTDGKPESLARCRIFLPTRRACSVLKDAFLELGGGRPLLLPRMQPLGDIDEEELTFSYAAEQDLLLHVPPAMPALRRQVLLARTIEKLPGFARGFDQALALAAALGRLMDQVYTEDLALENLAALVPEEFAAHWQITIDFLKILSEVWPQILNEEARIDAADRRNRLINGLTQLWSKHPPSDPVIAAGSTGSIPATASLLSCIAGFGTVILPGLDSAMDEESWNALTDSHPQYGLKHLLQHMGLDRSQVKTWPAAQNAALESRSILAREIMRPAATTGEWTHIATNAPLQQNLKNALQNLQLFDAPHERAEAEAIALLLRGALENPRKTAALVTPDRDLARRVALACRRWGITLDDSAGQTLDQTLLGVFLRLSLKAVKDDFSPVSLLALLKHKFTACGTDRASLLQSAAILEKKHLRGLKPAPGLEGLKAKITAANDDKSLRFIETIAPVLQRFTPGAPGEKYFKFNELLKAHLAMAEGLATSPQIRGANLLWNGEAGEAAAGLFAELLEYGALMPTLTLESYATILELFMQGVTVRPAYGTHPRLKILGQLEARLTDADLVILGGLNENTWPAPPAHDPWMSRPMRTRFGLPGEGRSIGLAAHDFVQGLCASEVVITRAARSGGAPSVPSRWLQRLDTVLEAAGLARPEDPQLAAWATVLDMPDGPPVPAARPAPKAPGRRPQKLSATRIETWLRDPYSIYARYVLNFTKLDPLEKQIDAAERGNLLHKILQQFVREYPAQMPQNAREILDSIAAKELHKLNADESAWRFWWPRFDRIADWLVSHETQWRKTARPVLTELKGGTDIPGLSFRLEATPDRIDAGPGGAHIIDYKSGGAYARKSIASGDKPQLALEALILQQNGFPGLGPAPIASLSYWLLTGGAEAGKIVAENKSLESLLEQTAAGLRALITAFDNPEAVYYSLPRPARAPAYNDYEHLARVQEWTILGDTEPEAA